MARLWWIGFGGFVGTLARYLLAGWALKRLGTGFPYGTLTVNVLGSLVLGGLMYVGLNTGMNPTVRLGLTTGFCGGFTTYSTFNYETLHYFQERAWAIGALNIATTVVACLVAGLVGWSGAKLALGN
jgi:CrcB protein